MLSILIPIYNFDVRSLVEELHRQAKLAGTEFEIILLDDHSDRVFHIINQELSTFGNVVYQRLKENVGRSKIRNLLARQAQYPYLLFMDCDSKVVKKDYIDTYLKKIVPNTVLYGGRTYQNTPPKEQQHRLHWFVGKAREEKRASERQKQAWHSFMTNNYLIPKETQLAFIFMTVLI